MVRKDVGESYDDEALGLVTAAEAGLEDALDGVNSAVDALADCHGFGFVGVERCGEGGGGCG